MIAEKYYSVVMQPCTICNLDCEYCYLLTRHANFKMGLPISRAVAKSIGERSDLTAPIEIIWHGGEPLATGIEHFTKLLEPFEDLRKEGKVAHYIQTNATLIDDRWCQLFKNYEFNVGVSIDGPMVLNRRRVDWAGKEAFTMIMKGISKLKKHGIPFTTIAVVSKKHLDHVVDFYNFFVKLGCHTLGINIEEKEGVYTSDDVLDDLRVTKFWEQLFILWKDNPVFRIREIDQVLKYSKEVIENTNSMSIPLLDPFPTVDYNGDVYLVSPEFAGVPTEKYETFSVGNLRKDSLDSIIFNARSVPYLDDFQKGVEACHDSCPYFQFCIGGQASNKYFELGTTEGTETAYCRNMRKRLLDGVLNCVA